MPSKTLVTKVVRSTSIQVLNKFSTKKLADVHEKYWNSTPFGTDRRASAAGWGCPSYQALQTAGSSLYCQCCHRCTEISSKHVLTPLHLYYYHLSNSLLTEDNSRCILVPIHCLAKCKANIPLDSLINTQNDICCHPVILVNRVFCKQVLSSYLLHTQGPVTFLGNQLYQPAVFGLQPSK